MEIYDYETYGGKNVIREYIDHLTQKEQLEIYDIREEIRKSGLDAFEKINTRLGNCETREARSQS